MFVESTDAGFCSANPVVFDIRSPGAELEEPGGQVGESEDSGSAFEGPCRLSGYVSEGVHVDKFEALEGALSPRRQDATELTCS